MERGQIILKYNNKSQGMPINTIVVAAIALIVLVATVIIFTRQSGSAVENLQSCELKNGKCAILLSGYQQSDDKDKKPECSSEYPIPIIISDPKCGDSKVCCLKLGK